MIIELSSHRMHVYPLREYVAKLRSCFRNSGEKNYSFMGSEGSLLVLQNYLHLRLNLLSASSIHVFRLKPVCIRQLLFSHRSYWLWFHQHNYIIICSVHLFLILFGNPRIFFTVSTTKIVKLYSNFMPRDRFYAQIIKYVATYLATL